jgi:dTDP-4-dehydrorhamnose 3,5-epimerase
MPIERLELDLPGLAMLRAKRIGDDRGWFRELFSERRLEEIGIRAHFVQDNMSCSAAAGTVRGLHAQRAPMAQVKLVTVIEGAAFDVVVDCRSGSPTFGRHYCTRPCSTHGRDPCCTFRRGFATAT